MWNILIVEDDENQRQAWINRLNVSPVHERYLIETAVNADETLNKLENKVYDVVVTDLRLPDDPSQGFQVIKKIKENDPEFQQTKVIVVTVVGSEKPEEGIGPLRLALQYGVADYIIKEGPDVSELLDLTIQKVMLQKADISSVKRGQVFIACPYEEHHDLIYEELDLQSRARSSSFSFIRADYSFHGDYLKERIYQLIEESEFVIAFISGLNSNVMYELGLAHGMGKKVIIVKDDKTEIVEDLKGIQHLSYERDTFPKIYDKIFDALKDFSPKLS